MSTGDLRTVYNAKSTLTTTNLTSLANGSAWQSAAMDCESVHFLSFALFLQTKGQAGGTGVMEVYVAGSVGASGTYADGATGTEGTFTAANRLNAKMLDAVQMNAATAVQALTRAVESVFGFLPQKFCFILINKSGATLSVTAGDHVLDGQAMLANVSP